MAAGPLSPERQAKRALAAHRELVVGRLADDEPAAIPRARMRVRRPRAQAAFLLVHDEQQPQIPHALGAQPFSGGDLRRDDAFRIARPPPVEELVILR